MSNLPPPRDKYEAQSRYAIALQRLIERFCGGDLSTIERNTCPHHYDMLEKHMADQAAEIERLKAKVARLEDELTETLYPGEKNLER
jgi:hypothetical protein